MNIKSLTTVMVASVCAVAIATPAHSQQRQFNIPRGSLESALESYGQQSGRPILYKADEVRGATSSGYRGFSTPDAALSAILDGTGFRARTDSSGAVAISRLSQKTSSLTDSSADYVTTSSSEVPASEGSEAQEIVVTGTTVRGAQVSSRVITVNSEDMRRSGHFNLGDVARALPQNFSGGQNPTIQYNAISIAGSSSANYTGSSALNLRGLGSDATLTLLNGARLPYDGIIQATDVASIPIAAIDRVEILLDGASAIYGSDAVGGVANILLKRDFSGADVRARYGFATDGGFEQVQLSAVAGTRWNSGGFIVTADYTDADPILARQRDYLASVPNQDVTLLPEFNQKSFLLSAHQDAGGLVELKVDAYYTDRKSNDLGETVALFQNRRRSKIWGVAPSVRVNLAGDWSVTARAAYGVNDNRTHLRAFDVSTGVELPTASPITQFENEALEAAAGAEGPLFGLLGGRARLSIGGGYREASFKQRAVIAGTTVVNAKSGSHYGYGEVNLPFVTADNAMPGVARLSLNSALRHENHRDFGSITTPKVGAIWSPVPDIDLKASWGRSFKAPTLNELYQRPELYLFPGFFFGLPFGTDVLFASGGNRSLEPERARVMTAGFAARPSFARGLILELGWVDIHYRNRIIQPNSLQLFNPAFAEFFILNPTLSQQNAIFQTLDLPQGTFTGNFSGPYNPAIVSAIADSRYANASEDRVRGFDVTARYSRQAFGGELFFSGNASWLKIRRRAAPAAPELAASGVIYTPASFKGRLEASWSDEGITVSSALNHLSGVLDTNLPSRPRGDAMTTVDLVADYRFQTGSLGGLSLNVAVANLLNRKPPFLQPVNAYNVPYDSTNYPALGRTINFTVAKRF